MTYEDMTPEELQEKIDYKKNLLAEKQAALAASTDPAEQAELQAKIDHLEEKIAAMEQYQQDHS